MLEVKGISKTYRAKSGVSVKALDNISLTFPERGMVFLLGKSGSGKSTLLNVIGGLDSFDSGELIIKGKSSKAFHGSDFDAYRNTFIGFIFQEYNILDEFSVGANIALALQLQGKRASNEAINDILTQVDLVDFAHRKPNELSGGQKQRIAIARALIKDPEIIMADEPTGALDSNTGRQVLDTLKKLSEKKLVIVVSHDREFAQRYGDRIIELSDGHIISDMSQTRVDDSELKGVSVMGDSLIHIRRGYKLTAEDLEMINAYLQKTDHDILLSKDEQVNEGVCNATGISELGRVRQQPTGKVETKQYDPTKTKFIKSRLPLKNAIKIGTGSMKHKPVRLIFTILLSFIAFALFGLASTMATYDQQVAAVDSLRDSNLSALAVSLKLRYENTYTESDGSSESYVSYYQSDSLNDEDLSQLKALTGINFLPVYNGSTSDSATYSFASMLLTPDKLENNNRNTFFEEKGSYGVTEMTQETVNALGFTLTGRLPEDTSEIVITKYIWQMFYLAGVRFADGTEVEAGELTMDQTGDKSVIGKQIAVNLAGSNSYNDNSDNRTFTITGVLDTGFDFDAERYAALHWDYRGVSDSKDIYTLENQLESELHYSYHTLLIGCPGLIDTLPTPSSGYVQTKNYGISWYNDQGSICFSFLFNEEDNNNYYENTYYSFVGNNGISDFDILWLDGTKTTLANDEVVLSRNILENLTCAQVGVFPYSGALIDGLQGAIDDGIIVVGEEPALSDYFQNSWQYIQYYSSYYRSQSGHEDAEEDEITNAYYQAVTEALNRIFHVNLSYETWQVASDNWASFLHTGKDGRYMDYVSSLAIFRWAVANYETVLETAQDTSSDFHNNYVGDLSNWSNEDGRKGMVLCAAINYIRDYSNQSSSKQVFGSTTAEIYNTQLRATVAESLSGVQTVTAYKMQNGDRQGQGIQMKLVGVFFSKSNSNQSDCMISEYYYQQAYADNGITGTVTSTYGEHTSGKYAFVVAAMPKDDRSGLEKLVQLHYRETNDYEFRISNNVIDTLDTYGELFEVLNKVFLYVGIGFAVFAALMMLNFISASVTYKKREIGVLRAVGARSSDVFAIFFSEAITVALINFALATIATFVAVMMINRALRVELGFALTLLHFSIVQVGLILAVSLVVAFVGSFLPVRSIARKNPVDAMRDR